MENISFKKAPVVELIAELRWTPPGTSTGPNQVTLSLGSGNDVFFQHFGNTVSKSGYSQAERVIPSGIPSLLHQVVWRFRNPSDKSTLLQVGPGIFSANALQPYKRWQEFRPTVALGLKALLETRADNEKNSEFSNVSLRYINAFSGQLLGGATPTSFINKVLGLEVSLPKALGSLVDAGTEVNATVNALLPIANNTKVMSVAIGDGVVNSETAAMFDVTVAQKYVVPSKFDDVMAAFDSSRDVIHKSFLELTASLHDSMQPEA